MAEDAAEGVVAVLANDERGDAPTTIIDVTAPLHGVVVQRDEQLVYTPNPNFHGDDAFMYTLRDGDGETSTTEVAVMVLSIDDVPVANADTAEVAEDGQLALAVLDNDTGLGDAPVTILEASVPFHGSLVIDGAILRYTPVADYEGPELFTYTIADRDGQTATAVVTVTVTSVSDPVVAVADTATTEEDSGGVTIDVLANDRVADAPASIHALGVPSHGVVELVAGSVRYLPAAEFFGEDSFTYTVRDGDGDVASATVVVTVVSVDDVPVAA
ncbi:MAG: tandem-95 repeat protein, partial [Myxococcales bacterium]|nr:tandem-95 repeat protein [Myxococcales bacterium]